MKTYPRLEQLGVAVHRTKQGHHYVKWQELHDALRKHKLNRVAFARHFGVQTQLEQGPFPYDVEAVLERILSGRLTGTQLLWD